MRVGQSSESQGFHFELAHNAGSMAFETPEFVFCCCNLSVYGRDIWVLLLVDMVDAKASPDTYCSTFVP